ncbi:sodium ABC transporter permease [Pseudoxanthomonas broegbernensis]|uniref:Sodium ABC transporter permease n=1 Tax=Pseudoxanthomonas broegbernensis TaxID=83619 RepID=A0A7V8K781_9GAMM|nr:ABC transporter permease [Pseudoxanthomonas broegbernensis]KAF1686840.1 sodium ABC transporter permease [Pseudoxanthomonas broegbernensis]MBB6065574.1 sodium transport system permease protein [Pseudoxanthomonas broegbernensis]
MSALATMWTVLVKELRDIGRDRRTLGLTLLLGPLLFPAIILGMGSLAEKRARTQIEQVLEVPTVGRERAPNLVAFLATQGIRAVDAPADLEDALREQRVDAGLRISENFAEDWHAGRPALVEVMLDSSQRDSGIPGRRLSSALAAYGGQVGALRLLARGVDASVAQPVNVGTLDVATPDAKRGFLLSLMLPYFLIITAFLGGAALVLDATAGERERQSLEPLLATPAARGAIVSGKIAAACVLGVVSLLLSLLAIKLSAQMGTGTARSLDMSLHAIGKMLFVLLPMLLIGTSLLTFLAAAAKSLKEAQSHMSWLMLLPMVPTIMLMASPVKSQLWQFAVPFLAQNQLLLKVIRGEAIGPQAWGVYLGASVGLAALLWLAAVLRYRQEKLAIST